MEKLYEYGASALTTGVASFALAKLFVGGSDNIIGNMSIASVIGVTSALGSLTAKASHDYVLPHIPQDAKWATLEAAGINAVASGGGALAGAYFINQVFTKRGQCTFFTRTKIRNLYTRTMKTGHFGQQSCTYCHY